MKVITALATPFVGDKIDTNSYEKLLNRQQGKVDSVLCCGTTGEGALLTPCERRLLVKVARCFFEEIWVGISSGSTNDALKEAVAAQNAGATGLLVTPPSFFKCTQEGFVKHVATIKNATNLPIMLYNAPSRCGYVLWENVVENLAEMGVEYLKDAGTDTNYCRRLAGKIKVLCGNEEKLTSFANNGACGVVSVASNAAPLWTKNTFDSPAFTRLAQLCFCEINPLPIKYFLCRLGVFEGYQTRLPLTAASKATRTAIDEFLQRNKLQ